jgi:hypothetical protein
MGGVHATHKLFFDDYDNDRFVTIIIVIIIALSVLSEVHSLPKSNSPESAI